MKSISGILAGLILSSATILAPSANAADINRNFLIDLTENTASFGDTFKLADNGKTFLDTFSFHIGSASDFDTALISVATLKKLDLDITGLSLYSGSTLIASGTQESSGKNDFWTLGASGLASGNYSFTVAGKVLGTQGGSFGGNLNVSPVPEPGTLGMMAGGLALLGFAGRRQRKSYKIA